MRRQRHRAVLGLAAAVLLLVLPGGCGGDDSTKVEVTGELPTEVSLLFVVRGDARAEDGRISIDTETVEWFSDRPERLAGVSEIAGLADRWSEFGLAMDPPNAAVVGGDTDAVVELSDPQLDGGSIAFAFEPLRGQTLEGGELGDVSVFVDAIRDPIRFAIKCANFPVASGGAAWDFSTVALRRPACPGQEKVTRESFTDTGFTDPQGQIAGTTWTCSGTVSGSSATFNCDGQNDAVISGTGNKKSG